MIGASMIINNARILFFGVLLQAITIDIAVADDAGVLEAFYSNYPPCNICGADDGVIGNTGTMLPMGTGGIIAEEGLSCIDVQTMALEGKFSPASCLLLPYRVYETCGCISSQPPPVFPPISQDVATTIFITFEGLTEEIDPENVDILEEQCAIFLNSQVDDASNIECTVEGQTLLDDDGAGVQVEVLVSGTPDGIGAGQFATLVLGALADEVDQFLDALQDASGFFDGVTSVSSGPIDADDDGNGEILGLDRDIFAAIVAGSGALLLMILTLFTCGRGTATQLKLPPSA